MRREFTANVSHELKTPLTSIMGYAEIISENIAKNEDIPMFASKIKKQAERLLTLIEDIIELSKLDEMKIKENFSIICLKDICLKCVEDLQDKANKNNISFENDCENLNILGTYQTLYELVYNLCDNAIKYNKPCGKIKIKLKKQGAKAILTIEDTGIGISPDHINHIFERFYRIDKSHSKSTGGTGLGLSIVKHAAILHEAEVEVESKIGKGSKFIITFKII
ncbi:MAG: ATP-binding protein [Oscillospiraceae bacterium]